MHEAFLSLETVQEGHPSREVGRDGVSCKAQTQSAKRSTCHFHYSNRTHKYSTQMQLHPLAEKSPQAGV